MTEDERKAIEQRVNFIDASNIKPIKTGVILMGEYLTYNSDEHSICRYLDLRYNMLGKDINRAKKEIRQILVYSKDSKNGIYINSSKEEILEEWLKNKESEGQKTSTGKRGRPTRDITSKMIEDEDGRKLNKIRGLIKGKIGKDAALIILAAIKKGWMNEPTFKQVEKEFGNIGSRQGFTAYLDERKYKEKELERAMEILVLT